MRIPGRQLVRSRESHVTNRLGPGRERRPDVCFGSVERQRLAQIDPRHAVGRLARQYVVGGGTPAGNGIGRAGGSGKPHRRRQM